MASLKWERKLGETNLMQNLCIYAKLFLRFYPLRRTPKDAEKVSLFSLWETVTFRNAFFEKVCLCMHDRTRLPLRLSRTGRVP